MAQIEKKGTYQIMSNKTSCSFDPRQNLFYDCEDFFMKSIASDFITLSQTATAYTTGVNEPHFNPLCLRQISPSTMSALEQARAFYDAHHSAWALVLPQAFDSPETQMLLQTFGFEKETRSVAMIKELEESPEDQQNTNIYPMDDRLEEWIAPLALAFEADQDTATQYMHAHERAKRNTQNFYHYSLYDGKTPVGSVTLSLYSTGARIDDLGVLPSRQKQGVGAHLLRHALNEATKKGAKTCVLDASVNGLQLYKTNGFSHLHYTQIYTYKGGT